MKNSKLVSIIQTLKEDERRQFSRFINSKLFNQHKNVVLLFEYIRSKLRYRTSVMDKTMAFEQLFPNEPYNDKKIRDVMSYLLKVLEQFLAYQELYQNKPSELIALSTSYRKRQLWKLFDSSVKRSSSALEKAPTKDMSFHYNNYQLEQEKYFALIDKKRTTATNLQVVADHLDISYFANRLRQTCSMLSHKNVYKAEYDFGIIHQIIQEVNRKQLYNIPAIGIYYYVYLALTETDNPNHFNQLQQKIISNGHLFSQEEIRDIYLHAVNIGIRFINKDQHEQMSATLELYKVGVEQGYLLTNGQISRFTYKNAIAIGLRLEEYDWAKQFIESYKDLLDPVYKEETYHFNLAKLNYSIQAYDKALSLLMTTALSDDAYVNFDTKILLAKMYYELGDLDALEALIGNFQTFIRRKQVISYHRTNYQNFINCLNNLANLNPFDKQARAALTSEVNTLNPLPEKYWFLKQLKA